jgi:hypothetical protein
MRSLAILIPLITGFALPAHPQETDQQRLSQATLPQFLASYDKSLDAVDDAYRTLAKSPLPLKDPSGRILGRRTIAERQRNVADLRETVKKLEGSPEDLVLTITLFNQAETLADDLYDLSQIAYDNDQEDSAERLTQVLSDFDHNQTQIKNYAFSLAAAKQQRIAALEKQNEACKQSPRRLNQTAK